MASLTGSKTLFAFTSPRTLEKIIPEIELLINNLSGREWNRETQIDFLHLLNSNSCYEGEGEVQAITDGMAARDRINRAPKALGFVGLHPISLTPAGEALLTSRRTEEVFTRQMMKFQLPSPYHTQSKTVEYRIKPYLELFRLINDLGYISKTELSLFFLQLINVDKYDNIKQQILDFRKCYKTYDGTWRNYVAECTQKIVMTIYRQEIEHENFQLRESANYSLTKFIRTKSNNLRDYADAFYRYIRATGYIAINSRNFNLVISDNKKEDVKFLLNTIEREPSTFVSTEQFERYLWADDNIKLYTDDKRFLQHKLTSIQVPFTKEQSVEDLKDVLEDGYASIQHENERQINEILRNYEEYDDIIKMFDRLRNKEVPDAPLFLEWNVWRAFSMIDHAINIKGNFKKDINLKPIGTAAGGMSDIEALYPNFGLIIEVTMSNGEKQYEMEGEPVGRHFGLARKKLHDNMYCVFIAPRISQGTLAHFYNTNRFKTDYYGGRTKIIPLTFEEMKSFLKTAKENKFSNPDDLERWMKLLWEKNQDPDLGENDWFLEIKKTVKNWTNISN